MGGGRRREEEGKRRGGEEEEAVGRRRRWGGGGERVEKGRYREGQEGKGKLEGEDESSTVCTLVDKFEYVCDELYPT